MAARPGFVELAKAAGVSVATVDRALNGREKVRADTVARIADAARKLGHPAALRLAGADANLPTLRFGVALHKQGQDFYKAFAEELHRAVADAKGVQGRLVLEFASGQAPSEMARRLRSMEGRCDVLAATAVNHPEVTEAVQHLRSTGMHVFALLSEFAEGVRTGYLGLDNLKHGRTAGWMMALATGVATMVIDTPLEKLCRALIAEMTRAALGPSEMDRVALYLPPDLHVGESV